MAEQVRFGQENATWSGSRKDNDIMAAERDPSIGPVSRMFWGEGGKHILMIGT